MSTTTPTTATGDAGRLRLTVATALAPTAWGSTYLVTTELLPPGHPAGYLWLGLVGGLAAYTLWFRGIGRLPVTSVAMLGLLSPIAAAALGAAVLGETFAPLQLAGFALALAAILGGQLPKPRRTTDLSLHHHRTLTKGVAS